VTLSEVFYLGEFIDGEGSAQVPASSFGTTQFYVEDFYRHVYFEYAYSSEVAGGPVFTGTIDSVGYQVTDFESPEQVDAEGTIYVVYQSDCP
jgi:hypothetical protein